MEDRFKFKGYWYNDVQKEWRVYDNPEFITGDGTAEIWSNTEGGAYLELPSDADLHLCQCTGLKDKNGKLIYEGDIIVIPNQYPFYDYKNEKESQNLNDTYGEIKGETILNYVGVVEYIFNGWQYVLNCVNPLKRGISNGINYHLNEQGFEKDENSCYEVIGNIYENPELLEE